METADSNLTDPGTQTTDSSAHHQYTRSSDPVYIPVYVPVYMDDDSSSTETIDNQPGAGRTLDLAYQHLGRKLERFAGTVAHRLGYGPLAIEKRINDILKTWYTELLSAGVQESAHNRRWFKNSRHYFSQRGFRKRIKEISNDPQ